MDDNNVGRFLERREFLLLSGAAILTTVDSLLSGCGAGSHHDVPLPPSQQRISGTVDIPQLVSSGEVQVNSTYGSSTPSTENGDFSLNVSASRAQVIFVTDSSTAIRGLSISIPGSRGRQAIAQQIDATSTAAALVFLTPGILTTDPGEAARRTQSIKELSTFPSLSNIVSAYLPNSPILQVTANDDLSQALQDCVNEWLNPPGTRARKGRSVYTDYVGTGRADVDVKIVDQSDPGNTKIAFSNRGWRYVRIQRRNLKGGQDATVQDLVKALPGATPFSSASLFTFSSGNPTEQETTIDLSSTGPYKVELWITGAGTAGGGDPLPPGVDSNTDDAWGWTMVAYALLPVVDAFSISQDDPSEKLKHVEDLWEAFKTGFGGGITIHDLVDAKSFGERLLGTAEILQQVFAYGVNSEYFLNRGWFTATTNATLKKSLAKGDIFFVAANTLAITIYLNLLVSSSEVRLARTLDPGDVGFVVS